MTRAEFIQQTTIALVRAGVTQDYAIDEAVCLAGRLQARNTAAWSDPNENGLLEAHRRGYLLGLKDGEEQAVKEAAEHDYSFPCPKCGTPLNKNGEEPENTMDMGPPIKHTEHACAAREVPPVPDEGPLVTVKGVDGRLVEVDRAGNPAGRDSTASRDVPRVVTGAVDSWGVWDIDSARWATTRPMSEESARRTVAAWAHLSHRFEARQEQPSITAIETRRAFSVSVYLQSALSHAVFLVKHKRLDLLLPIGGERQGDETPLETAKRKVREETGWDPEAFVWAHQETGLSVGVPIGFLGYEEHTAGDRGLHMNFVFTAKALGHGPGSEPVSNGSWSEHVWANGDSAALVPPNTSTWLPSNVAEVLRLLHSKTPQEMTNENVLAFAPLPIEVVTAVNVLQTAILSHREAWQKYAESVMPPATSTTTSPLRLASEGAARDVEVAYRALCRVLVPS